MQPSFSMSYSRSHQDVQACSLKARHLGVCDNMLVGFVLWTLVHTTEALAGGETPLAGADNKMSFDPARPPTSAFAPTQATSQPASSALAAMTRIPPPYRLTLPTDDSTFSAQEFRPRGHSMMDSDSRYAPGEQSLMGNTTVWQRLAEYRTRDRVRLVTLWETGGNSLSIQAGRRGDPWLQWTSRMANRGAAGRGLLDELFSTSLGGIGRGLHLTPRALGETSPKSKLLEAGTGTK